MAKQSMAAICEVAGILQAAEDAYFDAHGRFEPSWATFYAAFVAGRNPEFLCKAGGYSKLIELLTRAIRAHFLYVRYDLEKPDENWSFWWAGFILSALEEKEG